MAIEKKFVQEGLKKSRLQEYFAKRLNRVGYGGMKITRTPMGTQITIYAEKPGMVIGKGGRTINELTRELSTKFQIDNPQIDVQEVTKPELNAQVMATRLANALERGWYFRKAGHSTLHRIMDAGALGCEIIISGKLTGPRKRTEKLLAGYIKHAGEPVERIVDEGFATAIKKSGIIGVKVRIVPPDVELPDDFKIVEAPSEEVQVEEKPEEEKAKEKAEISKEDVVTAEKQPEETAEKVKPEAAPEEAKPKEEKVEAPKEEVAKVEEPKKKQKVKGTTKKAKKVAKVEKKPEKTKKKPKTKTKSSDK